MGQCSTSLIIYNRKVIDLEIDTPKHCKVSHVNDRVPISAIDPRSSVYEDESSPSEDATDDMEYTRLHARLQ